MYLGRTVHGKGWPGAQGTGWGGYSPRHAVCDPRSWACSAASAGEMLGTGNSQGMRVTVPEVLPAPGLDILCLI